MSPDPEKDAFQIIYTDPEEQEHDSKELEKDKEMKKTLLIQVITSLCTESSEYQDLRRIGRALNAGDKLNAQVISGGCTNYSYKVFLEGDPSAALYSKIVFPYALWSPDKDTHYDVNRAANEFKLMERFKEIMGDDAPVATPYACVDVDDMKVLVVEWASADEQWANQFIDGQVDSRIPPKLAKALATLNRMPFDDNVDSHFNEEVRQYVKTVFPIIKEQFGEHLGKDDTMDNCISYMHGMGQERFDYIMDNFMERYLTRECLCHNDSHCFNMLVEEKPNDPDSFGDNGQLVICDWEMSSAGPLGADAGSFMSWPIACAFSHAAHGHRLAAYELLDCCIDFWDVYVKDFIDLDNKDDDSIKQMFRDCLGSAGRYLFPVFFLMEKLADNLPTDDLSREMVVKMNAAMGLTGLKFLEYAFDEQEADRSLENLRCLFYDDVAREIDSLLKSASKFKVYPRRESALRKSGRRVSDSMFDFSPSHYGVLSEVKLHEWDTE